MIKKRKKNSKQFKIDAIKLITEQGYNIKETSENSGTYQCMLKRWKNEIEEKQDNLFPDNELNSTDNQNFYRIRKEVNQFNVKRKIFKKVSMVGMFFNPHY